MEKAGKTVESGQGYSVSMSNDTMTVRFADGTEAVRTVDPENPRTMLFDPEQLHQQAQAESRAAAQQEAPAQQQSPAEYADVELRADPAALETDSWTRGEQVHTAQELAQHYRMSTQAVQTVVNNMPAGIGAEIYAPAAGQPVPAGCERGRSQLCRGAADDRQGQRPERTGAAGAGPGQRRAHGRWRLLTPRARAKRSITRK